MTDNNSRKERATTLRPSSVTAAAPLNDAFGAATQVATLPFSDVVELAGAGSEPGEPTRLGVSSPRTVWYSLVPQADTYVRIGTDGSDIPDPVLRVWRREGEGFDGLALLGAASPRYNGLTSLTLSVEAGETYCIQAGSVSSRRGLLRIALELVAPPRNDAFAAARGIASLPFSGVVDTTAATVEPGEPPLGTAPPSEKTAWYALTLRRAQPVTVRAHSPRFPVGVAVYAGSELDALRPVVTAYGRRATFRADAGTTYIVQVGGVGHAGGAIEVRVEVPPPATASFFIAPAEPRAGEEMQAYDASFDPAQAGIASVDWEFGDGGTANGPSPVHRYENEGEYAVRLLVRTHDGRIATAARLVHVLPLAE